MNRAEIIQAISKAATLSEQAELVGELEAFDRRQASANADGRAIDLAAATVRETLTPVASFEFHTAATDWIGDVPVSQDGQQAILAEAALWFGRTSAEVRADKDEFSEQAAGFMRREASRYGEEAQAFYTSGMQYLAFLNKQAASGLDQVQQTTAPDGVTQKATPLPTDVFDNFAPEVHPLNAGVVGTEDSNRAPLLQEIESAGAGASAPEFRNDDWASGYEGTPNPEPIERTSVAMGYLYNLDDFIQAEAASGLDQVQQTTAPDGVTEKATALPDDVMFPWTLDGGEQVAQNASGGDSAYDKAVKEGRLDDASGDECRLCGGNLGSVVEGKAKCEDCGTSHGVQQKAASRRPFGGSETAEGVTKTADIDTKIKLLEQNVSTFKSRLPSAADKDSVQRQIDAATARLNELKAQKTGSGSHASPWYDQDAHISAECKSGGSGECDGYDYDNGDYPCSCGCHSNNADLPSTVPGVKDWHDEYHGVGKYASLKTAAAPPADGRYHIQSGNGAQGGYKTLRTHDTANRAVYAYHSLNSGNGYKKRLVGPSGEILHRTDELGNRTQHPDLAQHMISDHDQPPSGGGAVGWYTSPVPAKTSAVKTADMFGGSDAPHAVPQPGVAKSDTEIPQAPADTVGAGKADGVAGLAPAVSDGVTHPNYAEGYSEGVDQVKDGLPKSTPPALDDDFRHGYIHGFEASLTVEADNPAFGPNAKGNVWDEDSDVKREKTPSSSKEEDENRFGTVVGLKVSAAFVRQADFDKPEFAKAYRFASKWTEGDRLVTQGSAEFEAGLYAGISDNAPAQSAWVKAHKAAAARNSYLAERLELHEAFTATLGSDGVYLAAQHDTSKGFEDYPEHAFQGDGARSPACKICGFGQGAHAIHNPKTSGTTTDLATHAPDSSPAADGSTPINGPGKPGPLDGLQEANAPAGAAPYNGAAPFGKSVVPSSHAVTQPSAKDMLIDDRPGGPVDGSKARTLAFRRNVQAALLAEKSR